MEIVSETAETFERLRKQRYFGYFGNPDNNGGRPTTPESIAVMGMGVGDVLRFVDHLHGAKKMTGCKLRKRLASAARREKIKIETVHDCDDLLIMRVS